MNYIVRGDDGIWTFHLNVYKTAKFFEKEEGRQTKNNWRKNVSTKVFRVRTGFKVWEYHLGTEAVLRQYSQIFKVKIYSGTDNFKTTSRQVELHI